MKLSLRYLILVLVAVALIPVKTFSQQVNDKQADEALRQKAYRVLESLAGQIGSLQSGENPDFALKLGRESLKHGVSQNQLGLIYELNKKSRDHASALLVGIVRVVPYQNIRHMMKHEQFYFMLARLQ